jgi:hypothetical protein
MNRRVVGLFSHWRVIDRFVTVPSPLSAKRALSQLVLGYFPRSLGQVATYFLTHFPPVAK